LHANAATGVDRHEYKDWEAFGNPVSGQVHSRERAFDALVGQYQRKVFRLIFSMMRDASAAEELTQEVFLKLWRAFDRYDGRASLSTWIYTIAKNTALTWLRSESYRRAIPLDSVGEPSTNASADAHCDVRSCVERLPAEQRQVVEQYYFQDRSVDDVAEILNLPPGTVKSHLFRARRSLAAMLGELK
jgi:RNA polymerase sigma-70 factor (ECF subfamily)